MKTFILAMSILASQYSFAQKSPPDAISEHKKFTTLEMSNSITRVGDCFMTSEVNILSGSVFYTADFSITRTIKNKVWVNDQNGNAIAGTETIQEKEITTLFSKLNDCVAGTPMCGYANSAALERNCEGARSQYLDHLKN